MSSTPTRQLTHFLAAVSMASMLAASALAQAGNWTVIASGLNNPRGLDFAPNGALFIAEAGMGGNGPEVPRPAPMPPLRFGLSGSVTRVFKGTQTRIVTGLPSLAPANGASAFGPSDISFGQNGNAAFTIGLGQNPAARATLISKGVAAESLGTLWQLNQNGQVKWVADLAAFEAANDPDGYGPDSNPNGVWSDRYADYIADAGANALLEVSVNGTASVVAVFPNRLAPSGQSQMQSVPTNVVRGPDGAFYVSELTGFPFPAGAARIYRVVPGTQPTVFAQGFTNVIDLEFDAAGNLYVLEIDQNGLSTPLVTGRLARVDASTHAVVTIASTGLVMPGGMAIGPDGAIYLTNFSTAVGAGQVIRIQP